MVRVGIRVQHSTGYYTLQTPMPDCRVYPDTRLTGTGLIRVHIFVLYLYPQLPVACTCTGFHTRVNH